MLTLSELYTFPVFYFYFLLHFCRGQSDTKKQHG